MPTCPLYYTCTLTPTRTRSKRVGSSIIRAPLLVHQRTLNKPYIKACKFQLQQSAFSQPISFHRTSAPVIPALPSIVPQHQRTSTSPCTCQSGNATFRSCMSTWPCSKSMFYIHALVFLVLRQRILTKAARRARHVVFIKNCNPQPYLLRLVFLQMSLGHLSHEEDSVPSPCHTWPEHQHDACTRSAGLDSKLQAQARLSKI
jgi:hypothetical protein